MKMMDVDIFIPCFIDQLYPETGFNLVKLLEKAGCISHYNEHQTCCGQPAFNGGFQAESQRVAEKFLRDFSGDRPIVIPSASCTGFIWNHYEQMFENSSQHNHWKKLKSRVVEVTDFLVNHLNISDFGASLEGIATYHDSCTAQREINLKNEPRLLLSKVKGLSLHEMEETDVCCGFGGTFAAKFEPISAAMGKNKVEFAVATGADYLISSDLSCLLHLDSIARKQKLLIKTMHLVDVLVQGW